MQNIYKLIVANGLCVSIILILMMVLSDMFDIDFHTYNKSTGKIESKLDFTKFLKIFILLFLTAIFVYFIVYHLIGVNNIYNKLN